VSLSSITKTAWRQRSSFLTIMRHCLPSFSQYAEDAIFDHLMRPGRQGTYVDVGANHPIEGSNTFRLYLRGWRGLAIDPNPLFASGYRKHRSRDTFLAEGVSMNPGELNYYAFETDVYNTFDEARATFLQGKGEKLSSKTPIACRRLAEIVDIELPGTQIDLLNIDCEGFDVEALDSLDLSVRRPTVIMVEDYDRYHSFQRDLPKAKIETYLNAARYLPLAQTAWSGIYIAEDWKDLFTRSAAFDESKVSNGYLPGQ
jgi:FkbM family methyltransferase